MKIKLAQIVHERFQSKVVAEFEDGVKKDLFHFYSDELFFTPREFVGLTETEARDLRTKKDIAYLRS
jgi:hypothetical protein